MRKLNVIMKSLMVMGALFMFSCNNDDGIKCPEPLVGELNATETEFSGSWVFVAMDAEEAVDITDDKKDNPTTDIFAQYAECDRDLVYDFMDDRNYSFKQGSVADDCQNKQTLTGTWGLNGSALNFVSNCTSQRIDIKLNDEGDMFSYDSIVNVREVNGTVRTTKVKFTYEKVGATPQ